MSRGFFAKDTAFVLKVEVVSWEKSSNGGFLFKEMFAVTGVAAKMEVTSRNSAEGDGCSKLIEILAISAEAGKFAVIGFPSGV